MLKYADKRLLVFSLFACLGLLIFLIGIVVSIKVIFLDIRGKEKVYGEIIAVSEDTTTVSYNVNGRVYRKKFSAYSSTYYVGKKVKLYYDKNHPQKASIAGLRYLVLIAPGIGILMTGISGAALLFIYLNSDKAKLREY